MPWEPDWQQPQTAGPLTMARWLSLCRNCREIWVNRVSETTWGIVGAAHHQPFLRILPFFSFHFLFCLGPSSDCSSWHDLKSNKCWGLSCYFTYVFLFCIHQFEKSSKSFRNLLWCTHPDDKITCLDVISPLIDTCHKIRHCSLCFFFLHTVFAFSPHCFCLSPFWRAAGS